MSMIDDVARHTIARLPDYKTDDDDSVVVLLVWTSVEGDDCS